MKQKDTSEQGQASAESQPPQVEQQEAEQGLRQSERKYRQLLETLQGGIWAFDEEGCTTFVNLSMAEMLGYSVEEMQGEHLFSFMDERGVEIAKRYLERQRQGVREQHDFEFLHKDGSRVYASLGTSPLTDDDDNHIGTLAGVHDITERKRLQDTLLEKKDNLHERVKELDCLYRISSLAEKPSLSLEELLLELVELIPPAWQYPEIACARIVLNNQEFSTENFQETAWQQAAPIIVYGEQPGTVQVCYLEERPERDEGSFLKEERLLLNAISEIVGRVIERKRKQKVLEVSRGFLELANRHTQLHPLLEEFVVEVRELTGCAAVGLRLLDEEDNIPYQAYQGFSRSFYELESPLSLATDQCMCVNVIKGSTDSRHSFYTPGGSFYANGTTRLLATVSEEDKGRTRNVCNQYGYESVALIPIRLGQRILGLIHVADPREDMVSLEAVQLLEEVAMQLGTAIQRIWAEEELRQAHEMLERRVEQRTAELAAANERLQREIAERKQAVEELRWSREELRNLSLHLEEAREEERTAIAREIHDELGQALTALKMDVFWLGKKLPPGQEQLLEKTEDMSQLVDETVRTVQRIAADLRPGVLDDLGLAAAIEWQAGEFQDRTGIRCEVALGAEDAPLTQDCATGVFRIVQEALTNVARHAEATAVKLTLREEAGRLVLEVQDDGIGITQEQLADHNSLGLIGMRERAHSLGGELHIVGLQGGGTRVTLSVPLDEEGEQG